jgi:uncharacterized phiE125 gp8 family phage protein
VAEPCSMAMAKLHLRIDFPDDDALVSAFITAARQYAEVYTRRAIYNQTIVLSLDAFPLYFGGGTIPPSQQRSYSYSAYWDALAIRLPRPICQSVTSIKYRDLTNTVQTLDPSTYYLDPTSEPARIVPMPGLTWPSTQLYLPGSVQVTYVAGSYGDGIVANTCPQTVVAAILLLTGHLYEHREVVSELNLNAIPLGIMALLDTVRVEIFTFDSGA